VCARLVVAFVLAIVVGAVAAAVPLVTCRPAADGSSWLPVAASVAGAVVLAVALVTWLTVRCVLRPLRELREEASRFVADVSHELRTPLSALTAVVEVLASATGDVDADTREAARLAVTETHRLVALVEDLIEVTRFDSGTAQLRREQVELVRAVRDSLHARGWSERVELVAPDGEIWVALDRRRLDVIVANLVGNALRHGEPPVQVRVVASARRTFIEVRDGGPGLAEEVLPHVFERFYMDKTARSRGAGSGLGLAIARENAHLHGGEVTAGNADGGGARFVLRLPRDAEAA
jgi:two-component system sensor histidine kinase MtrB